VKWSERFATGIQRLDEQHQMLFKMSEDYRAALDEKRGERLYGLLLESLSAYAVAHFGMEQQCMYRYQCPAAEANGTAHLQFLEVLGWFRRRYTENGFDNVEAQRLLEFVDEWLANHIGRIDVQLKPCVEKA
jgi:hemerythrin-like metal-binding protein